MLAFVWISFLLIMMLSARLECIRWDIARNFLLRLCSMIFTVVAIYAVAQVNVFSCLSSMPCTTTNHSLSWTTAAALSDERHRLCPYPQYIILACVLSFFPLVIFLRLPMLLKGALLVPMATVFLILIEYTHVDLFECVHEYVVFPSWLQSFS